SISEDIREFIRNIPIESGQSNYITLDGKSNATYKDFYMEFFVNDDSVNWSNLIWHKKHSPRYSIYTWMALLDRLKTADVLIQKGIYIANPTCSFCHNNTETITHLFFESEYSFKVLVRLIPKLQDFLLRSNVSQAIEFIGGLPGENKDKLSNLLLFNATIYHIGVKGIAT
ncbi:uncharacterized protein LOC110107035, partial [Dendrobium catenatum]|uniref:uncharacterized protein LOC110107035 n=1 Tax=Dendrobium catenatum TaxID=906689 RepID=UPI0009F52007